MYAGHLGVALGAHSFRRTIPLWLLLIAAQLPDWLDTGMCVAGVYRGVAGLHTHGLHLIAACALALALGYGAGARDAAGGVVAAATLASHYALDYLTGIKPTWPGGPLVGLQLYNRPVLDFAVEAGVIAAGWLLYRRTLPRDVRNDGTVYAVLFALLAFQIVAGLAFFLNVAGQVKC